MPTTPWRDLKHKVTPEQRAALDAKVCDELARRDPRQPTGEACAVCGVPLLCGGDATTNRDGQGVHRRCAGP